MKTNFSAVPSPRLMASILALAAACLSAHAATYTWTGGVSQDWSNPANWNLSSGVPGPGDTARVTAGTVEVGSAVSVGTLQLSGGRLTGSGTLTILSALDWSGPSEMTGTGTTEIAPGATGTLSGSGDRALSDGRTLRNRNTLVHSGTCRVTLYNGVSFLNDTGATLDLQSDVSWQYIGATACRWVNLGSVTKSAGPGEVAFISLVPVNNGAMTVAAGSLRFHSGVMATNATFHAAPGASIHHPADVTFENVSLSGPGEQRLTGGTATVRGQLHAENLVLAGAHLRADASLSGLLSWSSGPIQAASSLTVLPSGILRLVGTGDRGLNDSSRLRIEGQMLHAGPGRLTLYNDSSVTVAPGGTVDLQADAIWQHTGADPCSITNAGHFLRSTGPGIHSLIGLHLFNNNLLRIDAGGMSTTSTDLHNAGSVQVLAGSLSLHGDGVSTGQFLAATNATIDFVGGGPRLADGATLGGDGWVRVLGAGIEVAGSIGASRLELRSGALRGSGSLTLSNRLEWSGASQMAGAGTTLIVHGATASLSGAGDRSLADGRRLLNRGTLLHSGTCRVALYNAAAFLNDNQGVVDIQSDVLWQHTGAAECTWVNLGSVNKSAGPGEAAFIGLVPANQGVMSVAAGSLRFPSGVTATNATFHAGAGAFMHHPAGVTLENVSLTGGTATLRGALHAENLLLAGAALHADATFAGRLDWSSGQIGAASALTILPSGTVRLVGAGDRGLVDGTQLRVEGNLIHSGPGRLTLYNGVGITVAPDAKVDLQSDAIWQFTGAASCAVTNSGHFIKSAGTGTHSLIGLGFFNNGLFRIDSGAITTSSIEFHNAGSVRVMAGSLTLSGQGSSTGQFLAATNTTIDFTSGSPRLGAGTSLAGDGWFRILGAGPEISADIDASRLELRSGVLRGPGVLTITSRFDWSGASQVAGNGTLRIATNALATLSGSGDRGLIDGRTLVNRGTLAHSGTCRVALYNGAGFLNDTGGTLDLQSDVLWQHTGAAACTWINLGNVTKSAGTGEVALIGLVPVNIGTMNVAAGSLRFQSGVIATNATFEAAQGAFIHYPADVTFENVSLSGPGEQRLTGGTATVRGQLQAENLLLAGAQLHADASLSGLLSWSSGPIQAASSFTVLPSGILRLVGAGDRGLNDSSRLRIEGRMLHAGPGRLTLYNGSSVTVAPGGTVDLQADATWQFTGAGNCSITNSGTFLKSAGTGTTAIIALPFRNQGTLGADTGTLSFTVAPTLDTASVLAFNLGGPNHPDGHGRLLIPQPLLLRGRLSVGLRGGYAPELGRVFTVLNAAVQGTFDTFTSGALAPSLFINPAYHPDGVDLVVVTPDPILTGPGQINADGLYTLDIGGAVNQRYGVEASTDLVHWEPVATESIPASTVWTFVDPDTALFPHRLYRVVYHP